MARPLEVPLAGVDGCPAGWVLARVQADEWLIEIYPTIEALVVAHADVHRFFIDMPIGLSSEGFLRTLDQSLRKELPGRSSTVFSPPCREALYAEDYPAANQANRKITGKGLSKQAYYIGPKIREIDRWLQQEPHWKASVFESHPEHCFRHLNHGNVLLEPKTSEAGRELRLQVLQRFVPHVRELFEEVLANTKRSAVRKDDVLDAIGLCVSNQLAVENGLQLLIDTQPSDSRKIPLRLAFGKPNP